METKDLKKKEESASKILKFIKEDHKFENWLLFILSIVLLVISVYIFIGAVSDENEFADTYFNIAASGWKIGDYYLFDKTWKVVLTSSCIIVLALSSLIYCIFPVIKPSFTDLKFVTWTDKRTLFINSLTVILFIAFLTLFFYALDFAFKGLLELIF